MQVSVFGLGYVGAVTVACLARDGHRVTGVDVNPAKVALVDSGQSPIVEAGLAELLEAGVRAGRIAATTDFVSAVRESQVSLICVGTPPLPSGAPDLTHVEAVCGQIGEAIRAKGESHVVVLRSTVPPGTTVRCRSLVADAAAPTPVSVAFNPEFLREGAAIDDFDHPPYTVIGTGDGAAESTVRELYASIEADVVVVAEGTAELLKWVANAWHAAKIVFANEVACIAKASDVDGAEVMALISRDTKLNVSPAYMRPGFAYGGSCLPKDVGALLDRAAAHGVSLPLIEAIHRSNDNHVATAAELVLRLGQGRVGVLGLAFKMGTDDLRGSPAVRLVTKLLAEGCEVRIFDRDVRRAQLVGTNLAYIRESLPHFEELLVDSAREAIDFADVVVVAHADSDFALAVSSFAAQRGGPLPVVDLEGLFSEAPGNVMVHGLVR